MLRLMNFNLVLVAGTLYKKRRSVDHFPGKRIDKLQAEPRTLRFMMRLTGLH